MAGRARRRLRVRSGGRRRLLRARRRRGWVYSARSRRGRGKRTCRTYGYRISAHKVPKRLRRRHRRGLPGVMRTGQMIPTRYRTKRRRYLLATVCRGGRPRTYWDRGLRRGRRRRRSRR